jgi:hypothetical protein
MAIVDVDKLNVSLVKKLTAFCKNADCSKGEITTCKDVNLFTFEFVNDGQCANDLRHIVCKDPRAVCVFALDYEGTYDWKSDTYIRPVSIVQYHF